MKYQPKKTDANQSLIVDTLRKVGRCTVSCTHEVGRGFVDVVAGVRGLTLIGDFDRVEVMRRLEGVSGLTIHQGANLLIEVKNPDTKQPWKFTPAEKRWHKAWRGQKAVVETPADALRLLGKM